VHVETDFAFVGMTAGDANGEVVHWVADPLYLTQVHYERQTPRLLQVCPAVGPAQTLAPGRTFTSFRTWILLLDPRDRERQDLAVKRMYRTMAPWVTENPPMLHVRSAEPDTVRLALDQCAEVGFELAILTSGSGFDVEDRSDANLQRWRQLADYAPRQGVQIGGYSLRRAAISSPTATTASAWTLAGPVASGSASRRRWPRRGGRTTSRRSGG
jgi:hypothetical protein